jgi:hypothetical protein
MSKLDEEYAQYLKEQSSSKIDSEYEEYLKSQGVPTAPKTEERGTLENLARTTVDQLPLLGSVAGGIVGLPAALVSGPLGPIGGAALGGASGAALKQAIQGYLFDDEQAKQVKAMQGMDYPEQLMHVMKAPVQGAAEGAFNEMGGALIGKGIGAAVQKASPYLRNFAIDRSASALGATKAVRNKLGPEKVAEMGATGLDEGIVTSLASTEDKIMRTRQMMENAMAKRRGIYEKIDEANASGFNPKEVASAIDSKIGGSFDRVGNLSSEVAQAKQLDAMTEKIMNQGTDNIPMSKAQELIQALEKEARFYVSRSGPANETAKNVYKQTRAAINEAAETAAEKMGESGFKKVVETSNKDFSTGIRMSKALENKASSESGNKLIGLTDTIAAAPAIMSGLSLGSLATGAGVLAAKKGVEKYGNNVLATSANELSKAQVNDFMKMLLKPAMQKTASTMYPAYLQMKADEEQK